MDPAVIAGIEPDDEVVITGTASSPAKRFVDLRAVVASVWRDDHGQTWLKVWPLCGGGDDKVWFNWSCVENIRRPAVKENRTV